VLGRSQSGWPRVAHAGRRTRSWAGRRVALRLHHQRRHRADQHGPRYAVLAVRGDVVSDLAATGRVSDVDRVAQVEVLHDRAEVRSVVVHVVPFARLCRAAVPATVVRDHAAPVLQEEHQLGVPVIRRQRPSVAEDDRLPRSPVLVEDLDTIVRGDRPHHLLPRCNGSRPGRVDLGRRQEPGPSPRRHRSQRKDVRTPPIGSTPRRDDWSDRHGRTVTAGPVRSRSRSVPEPPRFECTERGTWT
jgi:hypothetical protein